MKRLIWALAFILLAAGCVPANSAVVSTPTVLLEAASSEISPVAPTSAPNLDINYREELTFESGVLSKDIIQPADWTNIIWVSPQYDQKLAIGVAPKHNRITFWRDYEDQMDPARTSIRQLNVDIVVMGETVPKGSYVVARDQWGKIPLLILINPQNATPNTFAGFYCEGTTCDRAFYVEGDVYRTQWLDHPPFSVEEQNAHAYCNVKLKPVFVDKRDWRASLRVAQTGQSFFVTSLGNVSETTGGVSTGFYDNTMWTRLADNPPVYKVEWNGQSLTFRDPLNAFTHQPAGDYCNGDVCYPLTYDNWNGLGDTVPLNWQSVRDINYHWCD